jgi:hypothetical protein
MKKILILGAILLCGAAGAQQLKADEVPSSVRKAFEKLYPGAAVTNWNRGKMDFYEAQFTRKGQRAVATFEGNGLLQRTEEGIAPDQVPDKIRKHAQSLYPDFHITGYARVTTPDEKELYEIELDNGKTTRSLIYDRNNDYLREEFFENDYPPKKKS